MNISLIIPIYNQLSSFECVLESVKYLEYPRDDYEIIIVDDGSTEPIEDIVRKYQAYYKLKFFRHHKNLGRSAARNTGVQGACGKVLIFSDGDRILSPNFFEEHLKQLSNKSLCIGRTVEIFKQVSRNNVRWFVDDVVNEHENILNFLFDYGYQDSVFKIYDDSGKTKSEIPWVSLLSGNFSIQRNMFETIGGYDERFKSWGLENIEFGYRAYKAKMEFIYNSNAVNYHLYHQSNRSSEFMSENILYFYQKHRDPKILEYARFLHGDISLNDIDRSLEHQVVFHPTKIGARYKRG